MKLRDFLKKNEITEEEFSDSVGSSQAHINYIIRGKRNPSLDLARRIIKATDGKVNIADLFNPEAPTRLKRKPYKDNENT